jgi:acylphosphatase
VDVVRRRLLVRGRVQGVWFRESCRREAERMGVRGHARNLDDGRVEVVLEGDAAAVAALEDWCAHGPDRAIVTGVTATTEPPEGTERFRTR